MKHTVKFISVAKEDHFEREMQKNEVLAKAV